MVKPIGQSGTDHVTGLLPALQAMRLNAVDALRRE